MKNVTCSIHGSNNAVMSCIHLTGMQRKLSSLPDKVFYVREDGEEEATIWCPTCENARMEDKGWFDYADSIAQWRIICTSCLNNILENVSRYTELEGDRTPDEKTT